MTDIDFDELDKAVSATLGPRAEKKDDAPVSVANTSKAEAVTERSGDGKPPTIQVQRRSSILSPAAKRSGRFMDMVHPSSDMAQEKTISPASKVKIVPTENAPKPEAKPTATAEEVQQVEAEPATTNEAPVPDGPTYPDPLDVMAPPVAEEKQEEPAAPIETLELEATEAVEKATEEDTEETEPVVPEIATPAPSVASETPFIPDAKVEKRPLGGVAPAEADVTAEPAPESVALPGEAQLPPEADLPAALQSDVVAVESDVVPEENNGIPGLQDEPKSDDTEKQKDLEPEEKVEPATVTPEPVSTGIAESIPQQYKSTHSQPAEETLRPVFDTEQYHQPLIPAHAGQKNHTLLFILLIIALLAVGAGLGYFAYVSGF